MANISYRVTRLGFDPTPGDGDNDPDDPPFAQFTAATSTVPETYSEGDPANPRAFTVTVELRDAAGALFPAEVQTKVPFRFLTAGEVTNDFAQRGAGLDWELTRALDKLDTPVAWQVVIPVGKSSEDIRIWIFDDPSASEDPEDFGFELVESVDDTDTGQTLTLVGAQLTDPAPQHVVTIFDDTSGNPSATVRGFHLGSPPPFLPGEIDEPADVASEFLVYCRILLTQARPATGTQDADWSLAIAWTGTAIEEAAGPPADYQEQAGFEDADTVVIPEGQDYLDVPAKLLSDATVDGDKTLTMTISFPVGTDIVLGDGTAAQTLTIRDVDTTDDGAGTGTLHLEGPGGARKSSGDIVSMPEDGGQVVYYAVLTGNDASKHAGFTIDFTLSYVTADASDIKEVLPPSQKLTFPAGSLQQLIRIEPEADTLTEGPEYFRLNLVESTISKGDPLDTINMDADFTIDTAITDPPANDGSDGKLTDYADNPLIDARVSVDFNAPDMLLYPREHHFSQGQRTFPNATGEVIQFGAGIGTDVIPKIGVGESGLFYKPGDTIDCDDTHVGNGYVGQDGALIIATRLAEWLWYDRYGPGTAKNHTLASDTDIGDDYAPIMIRLSPSADESWGGTYDKYTAHYYDAYWYEAVRDMGANSNAVPFYADSSSETADTKWDKVNPSNKAIRDLCIYGDLDNGYARPPSIPHIMWSGEAEPDTWFDNIRLEHVTIVASGFSGNSRCFRGQGGGDQASGSTGQHDQVGAQGRIKVYNCQCVPNISDDPNSPNWDYWNGGGFSKNGGSVGHQFTIRATSACWDIRHPKTKLPYPWTWLSWEHEHYLENPTGAWSHSKLGLDPNDGVTAVASHKFLNLWSKGQVPPWAPAFSAGYPTGPYKTYTQIVGRPCYVGNTEASPNLAKAATGDIVFRNCSLDNLSNNRNAGGSPSQAFSFAAGFGGKVYLSEIRLNGPWAPNSIHKPGLIYIHQDGFRTDDTDRRGPDGRWRYKATNNKFYGCDELVFDDVTVGATPNLQDKKALIKVTSVRKYTFVDFDFSQYSGPIDWQIGEDSQAPRDNWPGECDLTSLVHPVTKATYAGDFSAYPGWRASPVVYLKTYRAVLNVPENEVTLVTSGSDNDLDNIADIFTQLDTTRLTTPEVVETWTSTAFPASYVPVKPAIRWADDTPTYYLPENKPATGPYQVIEAPLCRQAGGSVTNGSTSGAVILRGQVQVPVTDSSDYVVQATEQSFWNKYWDPAKTGGIENLGYNGYETVHTGTGTLDDWTWTLLPVGGFAVESGTANVTTDKIQPQDLTWPNGRYDRAVFVVDYTGSALSTGSKTVTLSLENHTSGAPQLEYPPDTGTYEAITVYGTKTATVNIVPALDYPSVGFQVGTVVLPPGQLVNTNVGRVFREYFNSNQDGMKLTSVAGITDAVTNRTDVDAVVITLGGTTGSYQWDPVAGSETFDPGVDAVVVSAKNAQGQDINWASGQWIYLDLQHFVDDAAYVSCAKPRGSETKAKNDQVLIRFEDQVSTKSWEWVNPNATIAEDDPNYTFVAELRDETGAQTTLDSDSTVTVRLTGDARRTLHYNIVLATGQLIDKGDVLTSLDAGDGTFGIEIDPIDLPGQNQGDKDARLEITDTTGDSDVPGTDVIRTLTITDNDAPPTDRPGPGTVGARVATTWAVDTTNLTDSVLANWAATQSEVTFDSAWNNGAGRYEIRTMRVDGQLRQLTNLTYDLFFEDCVIDGGNGLGGDPPDPPQSSARNIARGSAFDSDVVYYLEYCTLRDPYSKCTVGGNFNLFACEIVHQGADVFFAGNNFTADFCWLHDIGVNGEFSSDHVDCVQITGGTNWSFTRCFMQAPYPQPVGYLPPNSIFQVTQEKGDVTNLTVEDCWLDGGGYTIRLNAYLDDFNLGDITDVTFRNNYFSDRCTASCLVNDYSDPAWNNVFTGNRWDDGQDPLTGEWLVTGSSFRGQLITSSDDPDGDGTIEGFSQT